MDNQPLSVVVYIPLACGCVLAHAAHEPARGINLTGNDLRAFLSRTTEAISHWYDVRLKQDRHRCDLVSKENPNGFTPETKV